MCTDCRLHAVVFRIRDNGHKLKHRKVCEHQETLFNVRVTEQCHRLASVCCVCVTEDIQKPSGHHPGQLTLDGLAKADGLGQTISRRPFQPQPFCDTRKNNCLSFCFSITIDIYDPMAQNSRSLISLSRVRLRSAETQKVLSESLI